MQYLKVSNYQFIEILNNATPQEFVITLSATAKLDYWDTGHRAVTDHILWYFIDGAASGHISNDPVEISKYDFHWLCPGIQHRIRIKNNHESIQNYTLRFKLYKNNQLITLDWSRLHLIHFQTAQDWMQKIYLAYNHKNDHWFQKVKSLLSCLILEAFEGTQNKASHSSHEFSPQNISALSAFIVEQLPNRIEPIDLARKMQLSLDYFSRKFKRTTNIPPKVWIKQERVKYAAFLLTETKMTIQQITFLLSLSDQRLFSKQFKSYYGVSPSEYRNTRH